MVQAVSLFALLELLAEGAVRVSQRRPFADIIVEARRAGAVPAVQPVPGALRTVGSGRVA